MNTTAYIDPSRLLDRLERQIGRLRVLEHEADFEQALVASSEMVGILVQYRHRLRQLEARITALHEHAA